MSKKPKVILPEMKFSQYISGDIFKQGDIVYPLTNAIWMLNNIGPDCMLSIYNEVVDFDRTLSDDIIVTPDTLLQTTHKGYTLLNYPQLARRQDEILPLGLVKSNETEQQYLMDMRFAIKQGHKFGQPNDHYYIPDDNSFATIQQCNYGDYKVGYYCQILRPDFEDNYLNDEFLDKKYPDAETAFIMVSYPFVKMIKLPTGKEKEYEFVNIYSPITKNIYSVLYNEDNEIA